MPVGRAQSLLFSVGVMITIDNNPIKESNNLFSYRFQSHRPKALVYKIKID